MSTYLLLILVCMLAAGFYAGAETGAYRLNRIRLRHRARSGSWTAALLERVVRDMEGFVCMTLAAHNVAVYGATAFTTALFAAQFRSELGAEVASLLALSPLLLVFCEVLPKSVFQLAADRLMNWAAVALWVTSLALWPVVRLLLGVVGFWRLVLGRRGAPVRSVVTAQHLRFLLAEGAQEGVITPQQDVMVRSIMRAANRPVRRIMIPRAQVQMIPAEARGEEALRLIQRAGRARLVVYQGSRENVVGVMRVLDYLEEGGGSPVRHFARQAVILDAGLGLDRALRRLQEAGQMMGIVVDRRGRCLGIVTIADLLQELLGSADSARAA